MVRVERETAILGLLAERGAISARALAGRWPTVSEVTIRRDLTRLAGRGLLRRTHGGAMRLEPAADVPARPGADRALRADALILPPIAGRWAYTLREQARRAGIPFFAESSPQDGGIYLGPDNRAAGRALGRFAAGCQRRRGRRSAEILLLSLEELPNTRERARGFLDGFRTAFGGTVRGHIVNGRGAFGPAYRLALDALQTVPGIDVLFGVNDHSVLAGLEACRSLGLGEEQCHAYSVGGEGTALFDELARGGALKACVSLFPEAVGRLAIDAIAYRLCGGALPDAVITDFELIAAGRHAQFLERCDDRWVPRADVLRRLTGGRGWDAGPQAAGRLVEFVLHYPAHDWYRHLAAAMRERADELGMRFRARSAEDQWAEEIREVRCRIAHAAARHVADGDTVLLAAGPAACLLAGELRAAAADMRRLTVVTNSLAAEGVLRGAAGIRVILTGGEVCPVRGALLGPALAAHLAAVRADKVLIGVDGLAAGFGASCDDAATAEATQRFMAAAREVVVLADHSVVGSEARVRIAPLTAIHTVFTDLGTLPAHRLELASAGLNVIVADDERSLTSPAVRPDVRVRVRTKPAPGRMGAPAGGNQ